MAGGGACLWAVGGATAAVGAPVVGVAKTDEQQKILEKIQKKRSSKMNAHMTFQQLPYHVASFTYTSLKEEIDSSVDMCA